MTDSIRERMSETERLFREAEQMQQERQPQYACLYSLRGFQFCDLLLSLGRAWLLEATPHPDPLPEGEGTLPSPDNRRGAGGEVLQAADYLRQAVAGLREAGEQIWITRGLLDRAMLFCVTREFDKAKADLLEAREIAERGEMRLFLADYHLEAARLGVEEAKGAGQRAQGTLAEAREHLATAARLVAETGYHRRDREVQELHVMLNVE